MFQRGNEAFNQKASENTALKELRSFYLSKDKQSGNYIPKAVLHLHNANQAVIVKIHELKMKQPDGTDKYVQALCMNELGKPCECCMKGIYPSTVAIYKIYDFTNYTSQQDNQTKQVGVRPMLAKKTQQGFITSLASADPKGLAGRVVAYNRSGQYGRDWSIQMNPQQMNDQQLINFQNFMGGYTNDEIMAMLPITDERMLGEILAVIARGGAGTANSSFNPNANNNGGGMNFDPNTTFNNGSAQNANTQNTNAQNTNTQNNGGGMNFNPQNNGGQNNQSNNGQNNGGMDFNANQNNGQNNNGGGNNNFQTETNTVNHNNHIADQSFNPDKGGSMGGQDPSLGGGNNNFQSNIPDFTTDDIPF